MRIRSIKAAKEAGYKEGVCIINDVGDLAHIEKVYFSWNGTLCIEDHTGYASYLSKCKLMTKAKLPVLKCGYRGIIYRTDKIVVGCTEVPVKDILAIANYYTKRKSASKKKTKKA